MRRALLICLCWLVAGSAFAAVCPSKWSIYYQDKVWVYDGADAACSAAMRYQFGKVPAFTVTYSGDSPSRTAACRPNDAPYSGTTFNATEQPQGTCDVCATRAGASEIVNITAGWARDAGPTTPAQTWVYTYKLPASGTASMCSPDGCLQSIDVNEPCADCQAYTSQVPGANGLYRKSVDFRAHYSGTSCAAGSGDVPPNLISASDTSDPPCPGYVGEVNGVRGCYGTADKPVRPTDPQMPNKPQDNGNPAAGPKPSSGEGSGTGGTGRTPSTGAGGSAGGPAGAAAGGTGSGGSGSGSGTRPDGTTNKPSDGKEQQACGAPGQPKCQIDETGTPKIEDGKYDKAADQYKTDRDALRDKASGTSDKGFFDGWRSFWFAPPIAACVPFALPALLNVSLGNVDPCAVVEGVRSIMAYIWALAGLLLCVGMVTRTIRGGS